MSSPLVYVASAGVISSIGNSCEETFRSLKSGTDGLSRLALFDSIHRSEVYVGEVKQSNEALADVLQVRNNTSRTALLALYAARQAIGDIQSELGRFRTAFISANTVGGMDKTEMTLTEDMRGSAIGLNNLLQHPCSYSTEFVARQLGIDGYVSTINTACSSSVNAIGLGMRMIKQGKLDIVIAGGTDALSKFTLNGFKSLMILDDERCRPFDASRNGLNLGEGAAYVVLASDAAMKELQLLPKALISGYANTNDAFHQTASSPDGRGSYNAMKQTLEMAQLQTNDVDYINLHGTGTLNNDLSEGTAIKNLFGDDLPPMSSTKSFTGHTLGASGSIEAVISLLSIEHQCLFPNLRFLNPIAETGITPIIEYGERSIKHILSNSFGFGGNCSSILLSAV